VAPARIALTFARLCEALRRVTGDEVVVALRERIIPIAWSPGQVSFAVGGKSARRAVRRGLALDAVVDDATLLKALQHEYDAGLKKQAVRLLADRGPEYSALTRLTKPQAAVGIVVGGAIAALLIIVPGIMAAALGLLCALFFLLVIGLKFMSLWPTPKAATPPALPDDALPTYSVLVPLFRETEVAQQLLSSLFRLDYPRDRLDIKLILEASDQATRALIRDEDLPDHMEVIVVPAHGPQTKPKALNYALQFARGDLLTVFDAEDQPDEDELRLAAAGFATASDHCACLQARLFFHNVNDNWLTRQFAIEYACHFELLLPMFASLNLPVPLGGTSNHFRTDILRKIGAWDPYNVTEDADLGIRLARSGYLTGMLEAGTLEEANCELRNWVNQRSRWLKGWLQTWFVHMRNPVRLWRELGPRGFVVVQATMLGVIFSALVHPFFTVWIAIAIAEERFLSTDHGFFSILAAGTGLAVLACGYLVGVMIAHVASLRVYGRSWWPAILLVMPLYWLMMSAAAWLAVWQFIRAPFHWNKTRHGISGSSPPKAERKLRSAS
jgi:cellulose synthase/poly-beta-1,6-N-acetylglucosamine synthase-like glycosyltransferase